MPLNGYQPAIFVPNRVGELGWSRTRNGWALDLTDVLDQLMEIREYQIACIDLAHVLVEMIEASVSILLRRPHEPARDLVFPSLILVDPPVRHLSSPTNLTHLTNH